LRCPAPSVLCTHHWLIDPPNGPRVEGVCKRCRLTKTFWTAGEEKDPKRRKMLKLARQQKRRRRLASPAPLA